MYSVDRPELFEVEGFKRVARFNLYDLYDKVYYSDYKIVLDSKKMTVTLNFGSENSMIDLKPFFKKLYESGVDSYGYGVKKRDEMTIQNDQFGLVFDDISFLVDTSSDQILNIDSANGYLLFK